MEKEGGREDVLPSANSLPRYLWHPKLRDGNSGLPSTPYPLLWVGPDKDPWSCHLLPPRHLRRELESEVEEVGLELALPTEA